MSSSLVIGNSTSINILEHSFGDCVYEFLLAIFPEVVYFLKAEHLLMKRVFNFNMTYLSFVFLYS